MANEVIFSAKLDTTGFAQSMKGLQIEMKNLKSQLGNSLLSPEDRNAILLRMGEVKGQLQDMKYAINNIDPGDTFGNIATAMRPVVAGFGALTSAAVLFGGENKKLQELQTKIMATIQITQALQEIADTKRIKALYLMYAQSIKDLFVKKSLATATQAETVATEAQTVATQGATVAQQGLNTAMKANPIGAIIGLVALLVTGYQMLTTWLGNDTEETEKNNKEKERQIELEKQLVDLHKETIRTLDQLDTEYAVLTGKMTKFDQERNDARARYTNAIMDKNIAEIKDEEKKNKAIADLYVVYQAEIRNIDEKERQSKIKKLTKEEQEALNTRNRIRALGTAELAKSITKAEVDNEKELQEAKNEVVKDGFKKRTELSDKYIESEKERIKNFNDQLKSLQEELYTALANSLTTIVGDRLNAHFDEEFANVEARSEEQFAALEEKKKAGLITDEQYEKEKTKIQKQADKERKKIEIEKAKSDKAMAVFQIGLSTAMAIIKQLSATPLPVGAPLVALVAAIGALQMAAVLAKPLPKAAKGGLIGGNLHSNGGTVLEAERGEFIMNRLSTSQNLPTLQALNGNNDLITSLINEVRILQEINMRPTKAYVVESEITSTQKTIKDIEAAATF